MIDWTGLLRERHAAANELYLDLIGTLTPEVLRSRLPRVRSSPVSNHFWCVVGARESYRRAALAGSWQGFSCSLQGDEDEDPAAVRAALLRTGAEISDWLSAPMPDDEARRLAVRLLEHETQHHGQLIRYFYALPLPVPDSWVRTYVLEDSI
ncbi:hypothetical protein [Microbacterium sp. NIBRBAC000506063]|uniref:hypothetical protein n=1 Tax=Microbacterium sp. NIBRBAC000506063 TaxID=2734618 RepID=UPI001BB5EAE5|nr:hypothetical protein [Microbacterium sp. NIBRBAC000506063]QTV80952.1 hypothetical protein KAE78_14530 [Microbacterium sp. NIBRBAC000506063]